MVTDGLALCGRYTMQHTEIRFHNYTLETYIILLNNITPINLIKNKKEEMKYKIKKYLET